MKLEAPVETRRMPAITNGSFLALALPNMLASLSTPILGAVDTAVVGQMPNPSFIGAIAVGTLMFNNLYWPLGFLRVGTIGLTAQARGGQRKAETSMSFFRPAAIALLFGLLFIVCQQPIVRLAYWLAGTNEDVGRYAAAYFSIRIWGAPFALLNYVLLGWLLGMGKIRYSFTLLVLTNSLNIGLNLLFVIGFGAGVKGIAAATLLAEISAAAAGAIIVCRTKQLLLRKSSFPALLQPKPLMDMLLMNRDLFIRTLCLLTVFSLMTSTSSALGETALAANAILLQISYLMSYLLGGFADTSSLYVGQAVGAGNAALYRRAYTLTARWGLLFALLLSVLTLLAGPAAISLFTALEGVRLAAANDLPWLVVYPLASFWALVLEGVFIGSSNANNIRSAMLFSLPVFVVSVLGFAPLYGSDGIWLSFILFNVIRSLLKWHYAAVLNRNF